MTDKEWQKSFVWLVALFPSWKPDKLTAAAWRGELDHLSHEEFRNSVRSCMAEDPSDFAPGVGRILNQYKKLTQGTELLPATAWAETIEARSGERKFPSDFPEAINIALKAIGGFKKLDQAYEKDIPWIRKEFIEVYSEALKSGKTQTIDQIEKQDMKLVESGFGKLVESVDC